MLNPDTNQGDSNDPPETRAEIALTPEEIKMEWENVLCKFPEQLQQEFREERPNPTQEDVTAYKSLNLLSAEPVSVPLTELLKNNENYILHSPPDFIKEINEKWGTKFEVGGDVYDQNPDRVREYSQMPPETAEPSVIVDGEIMFGVGRFKAALLRKDTDLKVWKLSKKLEP